MRRCGRGGCNPSRRQDLFAPTVTGSFCTQEPSFATCRILEVPVSMLALSGARDAIDVDNFHAGLHPRRSDPAAWKKQNCMFPLCNIRLLLRSYPCSLDVGWRDTRRPQAP